MEGDIISKLELLYKDSVNSVINGNFIINDITKHLVGKGDNDSDFLFCKYCPCLGCIPNKELFEKETGYKYLPPISFCKNSFEEFYLASKLALEVGIPINLEQELSFEEFIECMFKLYGNNIGIGVNYFV